MSQEFKMHLNCIVVICRCKWWRSFIWPAPRNVWKWLWPTAMASSPAWTWTSQKMELQTHTVSLALPIFPTNSEICVVVWKGCFRIIFLWGGSFFLQYLQLIVLHTIKLQSSRCSPTFLFAGRQPSQQDVILVLDTNILLSHLDYIKRIRSHGLAGILHDHSLDFSQRKVYACFL